MLQLFQNSPVVARSHETDGAGAEKMGKAAVDVMARSDVVTVGSDATLGCSVDTASEVTQAAVVDSGSEVGTGPEECRGSVVERVSSEEVVMDAFTGGTTDVHAGSGVVHRDSDAVLVPTDSSTAGQSKQVLACMTQLE